VGYQPVGVGLSTVELWRPQLIEYRSFDGLDVHARSIAGCVIDVMTGQVVHRKLTANTPETVG
jgi:hypothetical protein